jgi:predicted phosphodiesterase
VLWAAQKFSSKPIKERIFDALSKLSANIIEQPGKKGLIIPFDEQEGKFIIFSDQHKGRRNGADDFTQAEPNYLAALAHYNNQQFSFINLGDSEELWENNLWQVKKKNKETFEAEKKFIPGNRFVKIFGNHDLYWNLNPLAWLDLKTIYGEKVKVYEGAVLQTRVASELIDHYSPLTIFLTHGHQGDSQSDGSWFAKFFVGAIWAPLQALLKINSNTPANNSEKKTLHNSIMYEWASTQKNMLLITGHTHQPVFASLTHLEKLYKHQQLAVHKKDEVQLKMVQEEIKMREKEFTAVAYDYMNMKPSYFNAGCCCFSDGDITGIEIADGFIRLIKWTFKDDRSIRIVLEEASFYQLIKQL